MRLDVRAVALAVALATVLVLQWVGQRVPPLQSPDELSHMVRIASLVEGEWMHTTPPGANSGGHFDEALGALSRAYVPLIRERNPQVPAEHQEAARSQGWLHQTTFGEAPGSAAYTPFVYFPAALGLALGRALDWGVLDSYHLARLGSQVVCAALLGWAMLIWRPPALAWAVLLLPMSLFQMAAPVVDGLAHALTVWVLSVFMRLWQRPGEEVGWAWLGGWCAAIVVLVTARLHMLPLLALPFAISWRHQDLRRPWALAGAASASAVAGWVAWVMVSVVDKRLEREQSTGWVLGYYLGNPDEVWAVLERTLTNEDRLGFLVDSFIGNLGWLDTRLPNEAYGVLAYALLCALVLSLPWGLSGRPTALPRLLFIGGALASVALSFLLMLLTWNPFPTQMIEGVQGRYFIAPALVLAYGLSDFNPPQNHAAVSKFHGALVLLCMAAVSLFYLGNTLLARYPGWARGSLWG